MNVGYIVDKDTGRFLFYGDVDNKKSLTDKGHILVDAINEKPEGNFWIWNGSAWVEDTAAKLKTDSFVKLKATDYKMARVTEDLIALLGNKASLPQESQDLITERETLRGKI